jgi:hypothetical protein
MIATNGNVARVIDPSGAAAFANQTVMMAL